MSGMPHQRDGLRAVISARAIALAFLVSLLMGCSDAEPGNPYAADLAAALEGAVSDFEREVFADGAITREEYEDAHQLWLGCMEQTFPPEGGKVVDLMVGPDGMYQYRATGFTLDDEAFYDATSDVCARGTIDQVASLFAAITTNPQRLPWEALIVDCLKRNAVVPGWYTADNLSADFLKASGGVVVHDTYDLTTGTVTRVTEAPSDYNEDMATDLDISAPEFEACIIDPQR